MIKKIIFLVTTVIFVGCSNKNGEFNINGSVDLKDGNMIYRIIADANQQPMVIDSIAVMGGAFKMTGAVESPVNLITCILSVL